MGSAAVQGRLWSGAARDWADHQEPAMTPCYDAVFDAIKLVDDAHLLDAGCGAGLAMQLAAKRGARPTGLDAAAGMLAIAWERLPHTDVRHGDLEELPFDRQTFDAVTAFDCLGYADEPAQALRELVRVARPGAPVAVLALAEPDRCDVRVVLDAVGALLPAASAGAPGPFALADPEALPALAAAARLTVEEVAEVPVTFGYRTLDAAVRAHLAWGRMQRAVAYVGQRAAAEAVAGALAGFERPGGGYGLACVFRYLVGRT